MWEWFVSNVGESDITPFEILILVFGVFAGGATVGYTSALFRLRTELRKGLWDELPEIEQRLAGHASELRVNRNVDSLAIDVVVARSAAIDSWLDEYHDTSHRVSFLSWVERIAWSRLGRKTFRLQAWYDMEWVARNADLGETSLVDPTELRRRADEALHAALVADADRLFKELGDRPGPVAEFRRHLHRKLRVGRFRRLQSARYAVGVIRFFVGVAPQELAVWRRRSERHREVARG